MYRKIFIPCLLLVIFLGGCSFSRLKKDLKEQKSLVRIEGQITVKDPTKAPIIVALLVDDPLQPRVINYKILNTPGAFTFLTEPGVFRVFTYEDSSGDQKYQSNERMQRSERIVLNEAGSRLTDLTIELPAVPDRELVKKIKEIKSRVKIDLVNSRSHLGKIKDLDDPAFTDEFVNMGLWQPLQFVKEVPFGIFFMAEYDPEKIPVLFVHGISGSPTNFRELIAALDKSRFQPWLAYYPSGFRLKLISDYFNGLLEELHARHGFKSIIVTAHSMGGLVSRALINQHLLKSNSFTIDRLITISTPWAGHQAADMGLKYAPAVIPVWNDVVPESDFLVELFKKPLPKTLPHYLLFSYQGSSRFAGGNSDGVVSIASQLRPEAQNNAALVRGFNETHTSILKNHDVSLLLNRILLHGE